MPPVVLRVVVVLVIVTVRAHFGMTRLPMVRFRVAVLERFELMQHLITVERPDVARLNRRETAHCPREMHEMRLDRIRERVHPDLCGQSIPLARVARTARRGDVGPVVGSAARKRHEVIASESLPRFELLM